MLGRLDMDSVTATVKEKLRHILGLRDPLTADLELETVGLSSLTVIQLLAELEEAFNLIFEGRELRFENFATVRLIADTVALKLSAAHGAH